MRSVSGSTDCFGVVWLGRQGSNLGCEIQNLVTCQLVDAPIIKTYTGDLLNIRAIHTFTKSFFSKAAAACLAEE